MKKILTLFAALCCMLVFSTNSAYAAFSDGVKISINGTEVPAADAADIIGNGYLSYDVTTHTLTMANSWKNTSSAIKIDASGMTSPADFIIRVQGYISSAVKQPTITFVGATGKGLVIEGDENSSLDIEAGKDGSIQHCCISCRENYTSFTYYPLIIRGGMKLTLDNDKGCSQTSAIECDGLTVDNSIVEVYTSSVCATGAVYDNYTGITIIGDDLQELPLYSNGSTFIVEKVGERYPVWINGFQLNSLRPTLNYSTMNDIKSGSVTYDPAKKILYLDNNFVLQAQNKKAGAAIKIESADPLDTVRIQCDGVYKQITAYGAGKDGFVFRTPVKLDLNGSTLELLSNIASGIIFEDKLEVFSSFSAGAKLDVTGGLYGISGNDNPKSELALSSIGLSATGDKNFSFRSFKFTPVNEVFTSGHSWSESLKSAVNSSNEPVSGVAVTLDRDNYVFSAIVEPEGAGTISAQFDGTDTPLPFYYTTPGHISMTATPADEKHVFFKWLKSNGDEADTNPYEEDIVWADDYYWKARFRRIVDTDEKYYYVSGKYVNYWDAGAKFATGFKNLGTLPESNISCATYAEVEGEGRIYYALGDGTKYAIHYVTFDGTNIGKTPVVLVADANINEFYGLVYDELYSTLYALVDYKGDYNLMRIAANGGKADFAYFSGETQMATMAIDNSGDIYSIGADHRLYKFQMYGSFECVGELKELQVESSTYVSDMAFDPVTGELIAFIYSSLRPDQSQIIRIDPATADWEIVYTHNTTMCGLFAIPTLPKHKITIKSNDELLGRVYPSLYERSVREGRKIMISALATEFGQFVSWSDGGEQEHMIEVTKDETYTATFQADPENIPYPIYLNEKIISSKSLPIIGPNADYGISSGAIYYDPETHTLTLDNLTMDALANTAITVFGNESQKIPATKVVYKGICQIFGIIPLYIVNAESITLAGEPGAKLTLTNNSATAAGIYLQNTKLILEGGEVIINGINVDIAGSSHSESLEIIGTKLTLSGTKQAAIMDIEEYKEKYCSISSPSGAAYNTETKLMEKSGVPVKETVVYKPWPMISAKAIEDGSATFSIRKSDGTGETFTDKGWFKTGDEVTIVCNPAKGYSFGHWFTPLDPNYKDPETKIGPERTGITVGSTDQSFVATVYYNPKSSANWYGVAKDPADSKYKFTQFSMRTHGIEDVTRADNATDHDATKVQAGDFANSNWFYINTSDHKLYGQPFSGGIEDGKALEGDLNEMATSASSSITDMAYDFKGLETYAVGGQKLYKLDTEDKQLKELGSFEYKEAPASAVAIAINAAGKMYVMSGGTPGKLYMIESIDTEKNKVTLTQVGEEAKAGAMDVNVDGSKQQSIAFDHATGELFWGAADYLRMINVNDATTHIVGDLGNTNGKQDFIKAMHRMDKRVTISVRMNEDQEDWGTVSVGTGSSKSQGVIAGTKTTINAKANKGYHFVYWSKSSWDSETTIEEASKEVTVTASVSYWAHFAVGEGIEEISIDPTLDVQKVLIDGQIYIVRDGRIYTITGAMVK